MVRVCAWCRLFLGLKRPVDRWDITHGICAYCLSRAGVPPPADPEQPIRILVVSRDPLGPEAAGQLIARAGHALILIPDRRHSDRRRRSTAVAPDRRRGERRRRPPASWADGYVVLEPALSSDLAALVLG